MRLPASGLTLPATYLRCIDGDTIEVAFGQSTRPWRIRLKDCWAPEKNTAEGKAAKKFAEETLENIDHLHVFIPLPEESKNLLADLLTFDRIVGYVFLTSNSTLNEVMILHKMATKIKPKK